VSIHRQGRIEFPSDLEITLTREFDAPAQLVFDVWTKPEHVRHHFAPFDEEVTVCDIDLRVGGTYHYVMVTPDGIECSFRGTFLEIDPPRRSSQTWIFDGWPGVEAIETIELSENAGVTTVAYQLTFPDAASRAHMSKYDGLLSSLDNVANYIATLVESSDN
jgi:uncharacterized protein YndB with AHSA1/START domain